MGFWDDERCEYCNGLIIEKIVDLPQKVGERYILQQELFNSYSWMNPKVRASLQGTWAPLFYEHVFGLRNLGELYCRAADLQRYAGKRKHIGDTYSSPLWYYN